MKIDTGGFSLHYWYKCRINASAGWREHLADVLRALAAKLDGRCNLAVEIATIPPLTEERRTDCLVAGAQAIRRQVEQETHSAALESRLHLTRPELFKDHKDS